MVITLKRNKDPEHILSRYVMLELYLPAVKFFIVQSIPGLTAINSIANICFGVILLLLFAWQASIVVKRSSLQLLGVFGVLVLVLFSSLISGGSNWQNLVNALPDILIISCTLFLTVSSIRNFNVLYNYLEKYAPIVIAFAIFMVVCTSLIGVVGVASTSYNMSLSYYCLVPTMIEWVSFSKDYKPKSLLFLILGLVAIVAMGSRGPILCISLFAILFSIKSNEFTIRRFVGIFIITAILIVVIVNYQTIVQYIYDLLMKIGIESRTLHKILSGTIMDDSNRFHIFRQAIDTISKKPFGIGFMGDLSSHNILIENVLWFGWLLGAILNIGIIIVTLKTIFKRMPFNDYKAILTLVFFAYAIPDAMLNLTVWGKNMFWIFMALELLNIRKHRNDMIVCEE